MGNAKWVMQLKKKDQVRLKNLRNEIVSREVELINLRNGFDNELKKIAAGSGAFNLELDAEAKRLIYEWSSDLV